MSNRDITGVFCPRNHRVGTVRADSNGLFIEYTGQVWHTTGMFGAPAIDRLPGDEVGAFGGYCKTCKKPVRLDVQELRAAAVAGQRDIHAPYSDTLDRLWVDTGQPPIYPPGTTRHKSDPR